MIWILLFTLSRGESVDTKIIKVTDQKECQRIGNILNRRYAENERSRFHSETFCIQVKRDIKNL